MQGGKIASGFSAVHSTFELQRTYDAPIARVWTALTDPAAKQKWFGGTPGQWELLERSTDVRVGGREHVKGRWSGGVVSTSDATLTMRPRFRTRSNAASRIAVTPAASTTRSAPSPPVISATSAAAAAGSNARTARISAYAEKVRSVCLVV
jgi:hypothetical protein